MDRIVSPLPRRVVRASGLATSVGTSGWCPLALVLAIPLSAAAQEWAFLEVADTDTVMPGRSEPFLYFGAPSIDREGNVAFLGHGTYGGSGLYTTVEGSLTVVADAATPIPGQATTFAHGFRSYGASIDSGNIAFYAFTRSTELGGGVYLWNEGTVHLVADGNTPVPGGTATFNAIEDPLGFGPFSHPAVDGSDVAFRGAADDPRQRGIYTLLDGALGVVADLDTPVPGWTGTFTFLSAEVSIRDGSVAFRGEGQDLQRGIYTNLSGRLAKVADRSDPIPGGTGTFTSVEYPWLDGGRVFFVGRGAGGQEGIYVWSEGTLSAAVDLATAVPGGAAAFVGFDFNVSQPSSRDGDLVFRALRSDGGEGVYLLRRHGSLVKVADTSDSIDGKRVRSLRTGSGSAGGTGVAFTAEFEDGSAGIFVALPFFQRGDANDDGATDVSDAVAVLLHLFGERGEPSCPKSLDADDNGRIEISDGISLLRYLFLQGPEPARPFPCCGTDTTADDLACESSGLCG